MFLRQKTKGFTIVELLIVIVVIAILAAITIVAYNGVANRAKQSAAASAAEQAAKKVLSFATTNAELYPDALGTAGVSDDGNTTYEYTFDNSAKTYCITATFQKVSYYISSGVSSPTAGTCPGHSGGVPGPWTALATGSSFAHSCGIASGSAYCWGYNSGVQVGDGTSTNRNAPVAVVKAAGVLAGKTVTAISVGSGHTCAIANGLAYCWGTGTSGQLGQGSASSSATPVAVSTAGVLSGKTVTAISAGSSSTCAIADGAAYCWGYNAGGELGNGLTAQSNIPVAVTTTLMSGTVTAISADRSTCAIASGQVYCWGPDTYGILGNGASLGNSNVPTAVDTSGVMAGKTATAVAMSNYHATVIANGAAYAWGYAPYGIGDGVPASQNQSPVAVSTSGVLAGKTLTSLGGGGYATCATDSTGKPYCWGDGSAGHMGNNSNASTSVPVAVDTSGVLSGKNVTSVQSGVYNACGFAGGYIYCWGRNNWAQLGNSGSADIWYPVQVTAP